MKITVPISLIIPTYNRSNSLMETITSYLCAETLPNEIIVVDQSIEETFSLNAVFLNNIKKNFSHLVIKHIKLSETSITKARNIGVKNATFDFICFSDDDVELVNDLMMNAFNLISCSDIGLIAGYDANQKKIKISKFKHFIKSLFCLDNFCGLKKGRVNPAYFGILPENLEGTVLTNWAMGFFFVVKRSLMEENEVWFDEKLHSYGYAEDLDFSYRYCLECKKRNLKTIFDSNIVVLHKCSKEYRIPQINNLTRIFINRYYLFHKLKPNFFKKIKYFIGTRFYLLFLKKSYGDMVSVSYKIFKDRKKHIMTVNKFTDDFYI